MSMFESVAHATEVLLDLLRKEWNLGRSLASMRADIGLQLLRVKMALEREGKRWGEWLEQQRTLARERGLTPLAETTVRAYIRMAHFRHAYPDLAGAYLSLAPWGLCAVLTLPRETLQDFARNGVPLRSGGRSPLADATVRQLRWGARWARAKAKGVELPAEPERSAAASGARAPVSADPVQAAIVLLQQAGRLSPGQVEDIIGAVLEGAGVAPEDERERTTRRQVLAGLATGARALTEAELADAVEQLVPISETAAPGDREGRLRLRRAIARLCAAIARGMRRAA